MLRPLEDPCLTQPACRRSQHVAGFIFRMFDSSSCNLNVVSSHLPTRVEVGGVGGLNQASARSLQATRQQHGRTTVPAAR